MRHGLLLCLVGALMLAAGSASADMYTSVRFVGTGNYALGMMGESMLMDAGFFNFHELAIGFGEEFQGEFAVGFSNMKMEESEEAAEADIKYTDTITWYTLGAAGFYQFTEGRSYRADIGARFQWHSAKFESKVENDTDTEESYSLSGWSLGPVLRHQWYLGDGAVAIGPEIYPKYSKFTTESKYTAEAARQTITEEGPEISGWNIDYSLRIDFFF